MAGNRLLPLGKASSTPLSNSSSLQFSTIRQPSLLVKEEGASWLLDLIQLEDIILVLLVVIR